MFDEKSVIDALNAVADVSHKKYCVRLIMPIDENSVIGVPTPVLRDMARKMVENGEWRDFIADLPHKYFEENQLHSFIISEIRDIDFVIGEINKFLPYVDNWATCDQMSPKVFKKNTDKILPYIKKWIKSKHIYTVRFAILCLMRYFLEDKFDTKYVDMVVSIRCKEYYINMMQAWYLATALVKQYEYVLPYFQGRRIEKWTHKRAIEKALESQRIPQSNKLKLKKLKAL